MKRLVPTLLMPALLAAPASAQPAPPAAPAAASAPAAATAPAGPSPQRLQVALRRADALLLSGQPEAALAPLKLITDAVPGHAGAWLMTSRALSDLGRVAEARDTAERSVALLEKETPERRAAWGPGAFYLQLGRALADTTDLTGAEAALRRADREQPGHAETLRRLGDLLLASGRDADAAGLLRRASELEPKNADGLVSLGNALLRTGDAAAAETAFRAALELQPRAPEPHFGLSKVAESRGDEAARAASLAEFEALTRERDARLQGVKQADEALARARGEMDAGRFAEAATALDAALALPVVAQGGYKKPLVLLDLARCLERSGDRGAARRRLEEAAEAAPRSHVPRLALGAMLTAWGLVDEGFPHLLRAAEIAPLESAVHAQLAQAWVALGRLDEALAEAAKASLLDPDDLAVRQMYVDYLAAAGRTAEARRLAEAGGVTPPPAAEEPEAEDAASEPSGRAPLLPAGRATGRAPGVPADAPVDVPVEGPSRAGEKGRTP